MINLNESMIMPMNGIALAICIALMILGYKKGFARSVLSLIGSIFAFYAAWLLSDPLSRHITLYQTDQNDIASVLFSTFGSYFINRILWFLICFALLRIIVFLLDKVLKGLHEIPGLHMIGGISGAILGAVETVIWLLVLCVMLETPFFSNGSLIVNQSVLGIVRDKTSEVFTSFATPVIGSDMFSQMKESVEQISEEQVDAFEQWLIDNDFQIGETQ